MNQQPNLLIVEDSPSVLKSLVLATTSFGFNPVTAETKADAMDRYRASRPDVVLLDVALPDGDGFEIAQEIRLIESLTEYYRSFIIFLTALSDEDNVVMGLQSGWDAYLLKQQVTGKMLALQAYLWVASRNVELQTKLRESNKKLQELASTDALTGIYNRRMFEIRYEYEWNKSAQEGIPISVLFFDVDNFKKFNDAYGHHAGDDCLVRIASLLKKFQVKGSNVAVSRYGGEEFIMLLPGIAKDKAELMADFLCKEIAKLWIPHAKNVVPVATVSIGLGSAVPQRGSDRMQLLRQADKALYQAKKKGRNQVSAL